MKQQTREAWIALNASYHIDSFCHPGQLLDDANLFLDGANGITQSLSDLLNDRADINPNSLANALWAAAALIQMAQGNTQEAHTRLRKK
jgi:hypothetical protein